MGSPSEIDRHLAVLVLTKDRGYTAAAVTSAVNLPPKRDHRLGIVRGLKHSLLWFAPTYLRHVDLIMCLFDIAAIRNLLGCMSSVSCIFLSAAFSRNTSADATSCRINHNTSIWPSRRYAIYIIRAMEVVQCSTGIQRAAFPILAALRLLAWIKDQPWRLSLCISALQGRRERELNPFPIGML